jgi:hypothetical protein
MRMVADRCAAMPCTETEPPRPCSSRAVRPVPSPVTVSGTDGPGPRSTVRVLASIMACLPWRVRWVLSVVGRRLGIMRSV